MKISKIKNSLFFILTAILSFITIEIVTSFFDVSNKIKQLVIFVGVLIITNLSMMIWLVTNYRKKRI